MTSDVDARRTTPSGQESRFRTYVRLAKLDIYDYYLSILVVASMVLLPSAAIVPETIPVLVLFLLGEIATMVALVALDDLTGYRDGSDVTNYAPDDALREKRRKPLVAGTLTTTQVIRFAWIFAALGAVLWGGAVALAPNRPLWTVLLVVGTYVISLQYSYGIKLSYHGFQEAFLIALGTVLVLAPHGLLTGEFSGFVLVQALLFGFGPMVLGLYSNTNDVEGDRAVGRPTVAALTSARGNAVFIGAVSLAEFLLGAVASVTVAPWWFVLLMLPATAVRARQYYLGFAAHQIMRARKLGLTVHRTRVVLLIVANVLMGMGAAG